VERVGLWGERSTTRRYAPSSPPRLITRAVTRRECGVRVEHIDEVRRPLAGSQKPVREERQDVHT
jgi:hypothetical protein